MRIVILTMLLPYLAFPVEYVVQGCDKIPEFSQTWAHITAAEPHLGNEMAEIARMSGDYNVTKCTLSIPYENSQAVDGLRTFVMNKIWKKDGRENMAGMLAEYYYKKNPSTGEVSRRFVSTAICRGRDSCERRGIIKEKVDPNPDPIVLDPAPKEPDPEF